MTLTAATLQGEFKFDPTERGGFMPEPIDDEWGLCDHGPFFPADYRDDDDAYDEEWEEDAELDDDDDEPLGASLARLASEIEAGRAEVPRRWKLDRPSPGVLVWTTPSGRRYAFDLTGEELPLSRSLMSQMSQDPA
jgi:hypothetical protein